MVLVLTAEDARSETQWQWSVADASGLALATHQIALDPDTEEYRAFVDPHRYLDANRPKTGRVAYEADRVRWLGSWIGQHVLVPEMWPLLTAQTVLVRIPPKARFLLARPLELAHVDGEVLARHDTVVVHEPLPHSGPVAPRLPKESVGDTLRILALFSLPARETPLNLRRERWELATTVRRVAARTGRNILLRVLQYGVTRQRLSEHVDEYPGWDVLHISGHGLEGSLLLEREDGTVDPVSAAELVALLRPIRNRLKLSVLSACHSGAFPAGAGATSALVDGLLGELDSVVLAMRYPVRDSFTVELARQLYPLLLDHNHPVHSAVRLAVPRAAPTTPSVALPALSIGTPALFGAAALDLQLAPPAGHGQSDDRDRRTARFPREPAEFVGRTQLLVMSSAALALDSGHTGVLLHGLPDRGKTWCAAELAYGHRDSFRELAWWAAPDDHVDLRATLISVAKAWHDQLGWPTDWVGSVARLDSWLPDMRWDLANRRMLLVLDGLHRTMSKAARWNDPWFARLMDVLTDHTGDSRVVLTSRAVPAGLSDAILRQEVGKVPRAELILRMQAAPQLRGVLGEADVDRTGRIVGTLEPSVHQVIALLEVWPRLITPLVSEPLDVAGVRATAASLQLSVAERAVLDAILVAAAGVKPPAEVRGGDGASWR